MTPFELSPDAISRKRKTEMKPLFSIMTLLTLAVPAVAQQSRHESVPSARYINVRLEVAAPDEWSAAVKEALEAKLNAVPDVQVVEDADAAMFTISVDIDAIVSKSDKLLGYSLAATICGTYDQRFLSAIFDELAKSADDPRDMAGFLQVVQYAVSGNVFLAGVVHTHGSTENLDTAYDQIVAKLKSNGLPAARKMLTMLADFSHNERGVEYSAR
jgi:hypothetical protein